MNRRTIIAAALLLPLATAAAGAQEAGPRVEEAWARATPGNTRTGAAYLTIETTTPDRLVAVATPVADRAELHTHIAENGVMKMRHIEGLAIVPGEKTVLQPSGNHIMLLGLKHPLKEGETFPLTLTFEKAGAKQVAVQVEKPGAMGPGAAAGHGAGHHDMPAKPGS